MSGDDRLRELMSRPAPGEDAAGERSLDSARAAFAGHVPRGSHRGVRLGVALVAASMLMLATALTPVGAAVGAWIRDAGGRLVGADDPEPAAQLPASGRLLLNTAGRGAWILDENGSRNKVGNYSEASWSPGGLYLAATDTDGTRLLALTPAGKVRWSIRPPVSTNGMADPDEMPVDDPRWAPSGLRIAYLAGPSIRVIDGDGSNDELLAEEISPVPGAWRPGEDANVVSFVTDRGQIVTANADSGQELWRSAAREKFVQLEWSADGQRLAAVTSDELRILDGEGTSLRRYRLATDHPLAAFGEVHEVAFAPAGSALALTRERGGGAVSEVLLIDSLKPAQKPKPLFSGSGLIASVSWAPDGEWLLVANDGAGEWSFLDVSDPERRRVFADTPRLLGSRPSLPAVSGWCCREPPSP